MYELLWQLSRALRPTARKLRETWFFLLMSLYLHNVSLNVCFPSNAGSHLTISSLGESLCCFSLDSMYLKTVHVA